MNRLALATVAATFVLILAGGLVTNTGAGLAVPDWPTTFGHNMFLFPWSGLVTHEGWLKLHVAGAVAVYAVVPAVAVGMRRIVDPVTAGAARTLLVLLAVQLFLGAGSFLARFSSLALPGGQVSVLVLPVAHRLVASLVFGAVLVLVIRTTGAAASRQHSADPRAEHAVAR